MVRNVFCGKPQGGKASPPFWDFDISEMADLLSDFVLFFRYADDMTLWYEITPENKLQMTKIINDDLSALKVWGDDNKITFELDKTFSMVFSQRSVLLMHLS